jgi:hypothetical protein
MRRQRGLHCRYNMLTTITVDYYSLLEPFRSTSRKKTCDEHAETDYEDSRESALMTLRNGYVRLMRVMIWSCCCTLTAPVAMEDEYTALEKAVKHS